MTEAPVLMHGDGPCLFEDHRIYRDKVAWFQTESDSGGRGRREVHKSEGITQKQGPQF